MENRIIEHIAELKSIIDVCNKEIEVHENPQKYGCCLCRCNCIVINKERLITIRTGEGNKAEFEKMAKYPTHYSRKTAEWIVKNVKLVNGLGEQIKLEIVGDYEYYKYLKKALEETVEVMQTLLEKGVA
jgi:hypothetical protein